MIRGIFRCRRFTWLLFFPAFAVLGIIGVAQTQRAQPKQPPANVPCPMMGQMGPGGAAMPQHAEITKLMDQVAHSAAALEKETNPTALKKKLAEHNALVKSLQTKIQECPQHCSQAGPGSMPPMGSGQQKSL